MNIPSLFSMLILFSFDHYTSSYFILGLMGISNGLANVLASSTWAEIYGVKYIGSIKALTTSMMVFSTALGTAVFGVIIDTGYSIEVIAMISFLYIMVSNVLIVIFRRKIEPIYLNKAWFCSNFSLLIAHHMARITVEDCLEKVENQFDLVLLAKERTSQLNAGEESLVPNENDKNTVISLREIGEGKISIKTLEDLAIT